MAGGSSGTGGSFDSLIRELRDAIRKIPEGVASAFGMRGGPGGGPFDPFNPANSPRPGQGGQGGQPNPNTPPPPTPAESYTQGVGVGIGAQFGSVLKSLIPNFSKLGTEVSKVTEVFHSSRQASNLARAATQPGIGGQRLENVVRGVLASPFVSQGEKQGLASMAGDVEKARRAALKGAGLLRRANRGVLRAEATVKSRQQSYADQYKKTQDIFKKLGQVKSHRDFIDRRIKSKVSVIKSFEARAKQLRGAGNVAGADIAQKIADKARKQVSKLTSKYQQLGKRVPGFQRAAQAARAILGKQRAGLASALGQQSTAYRRQRMARGFARRVQAAFSGRTAALKTATAGIAARAAGIASVLKFSSVIGQAVQITGDLIKSFAIAVRSATAFAERVNASNFELSKYNAGIAHGFAMLHIGDFRRGLRTAAGTEQSTIALTKAVDRMRDEWVRFDVNFRNTQNFFAERAARFSGAVGNRLGQVTDIGAALVNLAPREGLLGGRAGGIFGKSVAEAGIGMLPGVGPFMAKILSNFDAIIGAINRWFGINQDKPKDQFLTPWGDVLNAMAGGPVRKPMNWGPPPDPNGGMVNGGIQPGVFPGRPRWRNMP